MARYYGDTRDLIDQADYIARTEYLALEMAECRYCKAAQTRAINKANARTACKAHESEKRRIWVTSRTNESYWTA